MLKEVDYRMAEARAATHEFKRAVIVGAENPRTGATMADKFVKCVFSISNAVRCSMFSQVSLTPPGLVLAVSSVRAPTAHFKEKQVANRCLGLWKIG